MKEVEDRKGIHVDVNKFCWVELRRVLWKHSITPQEFFSYVAKLLATGDKRVYDLLLEVKSSRAQNERTNIVHTDEESLYSLIEQMRQRKEEEG